MSNTPTAQLSAAGVSIWLDDLSRERITSGNLQALIAEKNVVGVTTNPTLLQRSTGEQRFIPMAAIDRIVGTVGANMLLAGLLATL